jgi:hypothetical protein
MPKPGTPPTPAATRDLDFSNVFGDDARKAPLPPPPPRPRTRSLLPPPPRDRVPTLIFHGLPPVPNVPRPVLRKEDETPKMKIFELPESDLASSPELPNEERPIVARTEPPPPMLRPIVQQHRLRLAIAAVAVAGIFFQSVLVVYLAGSAAPRQARTGAAANAVARTGDARVEGLCVTRGGQKVLVRRASVGAGVESSSLGARVAFGVAVGGREGRAIEVDPETLAIRSSARVSGALPARRVTPLLTQEEPADALVDADDRTSALAQARTVLDPQRGPVTLGTQGGYLAWSSRGADPAAPLARLEAGPQPAEALRAVPFGDGMAVAFRRASAIWIVAPGGDDARAAEEAPLRLSESGKMVGSPALAVVGSDLVVAWAERSHSGPWNIRWLRWRPGLSAPVAHRLALPAGGLGEQAMSPGVAAIDRERLLMVWTEGPVAAHQVRAQALRLDGAAVGAPLDLSASGVYAGQGNAVVLPDGRGVIAYLASTGAGQFDLVGVPIACAPHP